MMAYSSRIVQRLVAAPISTTAASSFLLAAVRNLRISRLPHCHTHTHTLPNSAAFSTTATVAFTAGTGSGSGSASGSGVSASSCATSSSSSSSSISVSMSSPPFQFNLQPLFSSLGPRPSQLSVAAFAPIRLHAVTPLRTVPAHIEKPDYADPTRALSDPRGSQFATTEIEIKDAAAIEKMKNVCRLTALARAYAGTLIRPGVTTDEIDSAVHQYILSFGAYPTPLLYAKFPKSLCSSVNEVVVHGIPDRRPLQNGDIVNIDVSVYKDGYHGDCNATFIAGNADAAATHLIKVTRAALDAAISVCRPGTPFNAIGAIIDDIASHYGYSLIRNFCGHGIGRSLHIPPLIRHFRNDDDTRIMKEGMTFTIEPMLCEGTNDTLMLEDGWTIVTKDGKRSAQFEETLLITKNGCQVLTAI